MATAKKAAAKKSARKRSGASAEVAELRREIEELRRQAGTTSLEAPPTAGMRKPYPREKGALDPVVFQDLVTLGLIDPIAPSLTK